jgi:hypothetical protein
VFRDERLRHRTRSIRFEVIVPFRVFPGGEVVSCLGYSHPVWPWRSQNARPGRCFLIHPRSRTRLLERSSLEVRSSFTACTRNLCPRPSGQGQLSWDFVPLQRVQTARVHVLPFDGKATLTRPEGLVRSSPAGPTLPATVPLSGFLNLSATLLLSLPSHHFQVGGTRGVVPSRDLLLSRRLRQLVAAGFPS